MANNAHIRSTFKHALIYGSAGLIGKAVGFIMLPIYAHHLRGEGYGVIGMIDVVLSVLTLLVGYGISGAMNRFYYETNDVDQRRTIVSTTIILMFFLVVAITLPVLLLHEQVASLAFGRDDWGHYIVLATFAFMGEMTARNAENYILIRQQSVYLSFLSLCKLVVSLSLNIYFIVVLRMGVLGYLYASLITAVLYTLVVHVNALRQVGLVFNTGVARAVLGFSLPLLPGYVAMFIRGNADRVILRTFLGLAQVGVFEMLFKFATLIGFFAVEPFSKIWQVKRFEVCDLEDGPATLARVFTYHVACMMFLTLLLSLEIPIVLRLLTPEEFWLSGFIVFFAVLSRVFIAIYYHMFFGLLYAKKTFNISIIQASSAAFSLLINLLCIKAYGLFGAVAASCLSGLFQCVLGYYLARPYYVVPFEWGRVTQMFALTSVLYGIGKNITIAQTAFAGWLNAVIAPIIEALGPLLWLDRIKNGKILDYLVTSMPLVADALIMAAFSGLFVVGLVFLGIIPRAVLGRVFCMATLRRPSRIFSGS